MTDYVYVCRDGQNEELRYSIRSVVKHMPPGKIWVVGGKPDWYTGNYIPVVQRMSKVRNVISNLSAICSAQEISGDFILMNDDFFVIKPVKTIKQYHGGLLSEKIYLYQDLQPTSSYTRSLEETRRRLLRLGIEDPIDYEIHVPMAMNKSNLREVLGDKGLWRSLYGNLFKVSGKKIDDVKVYTSSPLLRKSYDYLEPKMEYISSDDESFRLLLKPMLESMFPDPTIYELFQSALVLSTET